MNIRVDWRSALALVGMVVKWLAVTMTLPLAVGIFDVFTRVSNGTSVTFSLAMETGVVGLLAGMAVAVVVGLGLERLEPDPDLGHREGFLMVAMTWLFVSLVGAVPYLVAGTGTLGVPINAFFESMSGFTTTGATVLADISIETHSRAIMLWRQETQWLGGMGIVVLALAILPELSVGGSQLMSAEAPGPSIQKLTPRIAETAKALWRVYLGISLLEVLLLYGLHLGGFAPNMTAYHAVSHAFTTLSTGGFSPEARSIEAFSAAVQWVIIPFMVAAGTNFALFWQALRETPDVFFSDREFPVYIGIMGAVALILSAILYSTGVPGAESKTIESALRHGLFQSATMITTTGYANVDFNLWGSTAKYLMFGAMFVGGSAGSTGGSVKIIRWIVVFKAIRRELFTSVHPEAVSPIRLGNRSLDESIVRGILSFTGFYVVLFFLASALLSLELLRSGMDMGVLPTMSAVAATLGNVGPGFGAVGPMNNYLGFSTPAKLLLIWLMWVGRLEIIPVAILLIKAYWEK